MRATLAHALRRLEDRDAVGDELERVAVGGGDEDVPRPGGRPRREEVVRLVPVRLGGGEAARPDDVRQQLELLEQRLLEHAARLVRLERLVAVRRHAQRVPADEHGVRALRLPEADEHVREPDDRVEADRLRQRVVRAVRERVAVDDEQRAHSVASSSSMRAISRVVASNAASRTSPPRRSSMSTGAP